jgi:hypothetical protein
MVSELARDGEIFASPSWAHECSGWLQRGQWDLLCQLPEVLDRGGHVCQGPPTEDVAAKSDYLVRDHSGSPNRVIEHSTNAMNPGHLPLSVELGSMAA